MLFLSVFGVSPRERTHIPSKLGAVAQMLEDGNARPDEIEMIAGKKKNVIHEAFKIIRTDEPKL